jgi:hypothetical protein
MSKQGETPNQSAIDARLSRRLAKTYGTLSRRSFLSLLTRRVIGAAGVVLAAEVMPFWPNDAMAQSVNCGLHGTVCNATCSKTGDMLAWTQCCELGCGAWYCCSYFDVCGTLPAGCNSGSGTAWCLNGQIYRCTIVECDTNHAYSSAPECAGHCLNNCNL